MKTSLILLILSIQLNILHSESIVIGCDITSLQQESCNEGDIFATEQKKTLFKLKELKEDNQQSLIKFTPNKKSITKYINMTKKLSTINVLHQKKNLTILRRAISGNQSCPPSCIQPFTIQNIKTIGTLETLKFIEKSNTNKRIILVDARAVFDYKKYTIPTAANIPNRILEKGSKHTELILRLLGVKKIDEKWVFKHLHTLLIFDNGILDNQANRLILRFIELGYPQDKILYYHGGIERWRDLKLTIV